MDKNILILSAGRRVSLVSIFKEEVRKLGLSSLIFSADCSPELAPACMVADRSVRCARFDEKGFVEELKRLCLENNVGMVIPTIDVGLDILSSVINEFRELNIDIIVSSTDVIGLAHDKRRTAKVFSELGFGTIAEYTSDSVKFPCFVKPRFGSRSVGAFKAFSERDLSCVTSREDWLIQEYIGNGYREMTVDLYFGRDSSLKCAVPRLRIEVRAGEVSKSKTIKGFAYREICHQLKELRGARGCLNLQIFVNEETSDIRIIELNPRFGGGFPLSHASGANYVSWLIVEYFQGKNLPFFDDWSDSLLMLRHDNEIYIGA